MSTLVVRLSSPLQSFGDSSMFRTRFTGPDPTLSALQGMLAAAAGVGRGETLPDEIAELDPVIRVERAGSLLRDYHTVNPLDTAAVRGLDQMSARTRKRLVVILRADGSVSDAPLVTERFYRQDAEYLAFLPDDSGQLERWLRTPVFGLYAGRKACVLTAPFLLGRSQASATAAAGTLATVETPAGDTAVREMITFAEPARYVRTEVRNDRMTRDRRHARQPRFYQRVEVPVAPSWFDVAAQLRAQPAKETSC